MQLAATLPSAQAGVRFRTLLNTQVHERALMAGTWQIQPLLDIFNSAIYLFCLVLVYLLF